MPSESSELSGRSRHDYREIAAAAVICILISGIAGAMFLSASRDDIPVVPIASPKPLTPLTPNPLADCQPAEKAFGVCPAPTQDRCSPADKALRVC
jgi:hypothetical protein